MRCGLVSSSLVVALASATVLGTAAPSAEPSGELPQTPALLRFLAIDRSVIRQATSIRHLIARNDQFDTDAWMDVRTEADENGFRYTVLAEGGSGLVRSKALKGALQQEQKLWTESQSDRAWFTTDNYEFEDAGFDSDGMARIAVRPRRRDMLLVTGTIFLRPDDGELVRLEGTLGKSPSFWTRQIHVVRRYTRIAGVHVPIEMESIAQIRIAGSSTFRMDYRYEAINGMRIE
jgi:hypothetical protein